MTSGSPKRRPAVVIPGLLFLVLGVTGVVLAYVTVDWYSLRDVVAYDGPPTADFSYLAGDMGPSGAEHAYFQWGGWLLLVICAALVLLGTLPVPSRIGYATAATILSVAAAGLTLFVSVAVLPSDLRSDWTSLASAGPYMATGAFLALAVGGAAGAVARLST